MLSQHLGVKFRELILKKEEHRLTHLCQAYLINIVGTFDKNFNFNSRRDLQKKSYERRAYESVDEKSL